MWIALAIFAAVPLAGLVYLASLDGSFNIRRSLEIDAPIEAVFDAVIDFKSWPEWSPWLIHEPDTRLEYSNDYREDGGYYSWNGKVVGAGRLTHVAITPGSRIDQQIDFIRPFRASNQVKWEFEAHDGKTAVSWEMRGRMPFLLRFLTAKMEPMISRDYDLGLALLNGYLNSDAPHPQLTFIGRQQLDSFSYWSIPCGGNLRQLEAARQPNIEALQAAAAGKSGLAFTLYHRFDPMASSYNAEIGIPVIESTPQSNYIRREFEGGNYFQLTLRGAQKFIPLAWYALARHCRMHKLKIDNTRPSLEIYHDDPATTDDSSQVKTALYLPIK